MDEQVLKPIQEATYLTVANAWRYRSVLRYCYSQHERLRHYLLLEDLSAAQGQSFFLRLYRRDAPTGFGATCSLEKLDSPPVTNLHLTRLRLREWLLVWKTWGKDLAVL